MAEVITYKCPNCAAPINFDSSSQKMKCASCGTEMETAAFEAYDAALKQQAPQSAPEWKSPDTAQWKDEKISALICQSCGGELITEETTVATECPYCGNAAVVPKQVSDMLRPDFIIPFKLDKSTAKEALKKFYKGKFLLPKFFKDDNRIDQMQGIYVPFWLYDCDTASDSVYDATRISSWRQGDTQYTRTDHFLISRSGNMGFEKIPADGSKKMDDTMMESIEPFDYKEIQPFSMAYLSGYTADKYDVGETENRQRVNQRIRQSIENALRNTVVGYSSVITRSMNVHVQNGQVHYALFPVWMLNTKWKDKNYTFVMNGQTGTLVGDLPIDWKKAMKIGGIIAAAVAVVLSAGVLLLKPWSILSNLKYISIAALIVAGIMGLTFLPFVKKSKKENGKK